VQLPKDSLQQHIEDLIDRYHPPDGVACDARLRRDPDVIRRWVTRHPGRGVLPSEGLGDAVSHLVASTKVVPEGDPPEPEVRVYPELARAAVTGGHDREYRLWTLARDILDPQGSGWVSVPELLGLCRDLGLSQRLTKRLIGKADGLFWQAVGDRLRLLGLRAVSVAMGCEKGPGRPVLVPLDKIGGLQSWRAHCYAAWIASRGPTGATMARSTLCSLWGRTAPTLRAWEALAGIEVTENIGYGPRRGSGDGERVLMAYPDRDRTWLGYVNHRLCECWQISSTYVSSLRLAAWGQVRKVKRYCCGAFSNGDEGQQRHDRLYYSDPRAAAKAIEAGRAIYLEAGLHQGHGKGQGLWAFCFSG